MFTNEKRIAERREAYQGMTRKELYFHAKLMKLAGRSKMNKAELIDAIMECYVASVRASLAYLAR